MGGRLLSLGAIAMDIVLSSNTLPYDDGFAFVSDEKMLPGGSASNVSVSAAHLGLRVFQTGKIGSDSIGEEFRRTLREDGVDDRYIVEKENGTTLHTYILTAPGGHHCIFANLGDSVGTLRPDELPENLIDSMDIFYTDMFSQEASLALAEEAVRQKKPVLYNMQCVPSFMELCGTTRSSIGKMMSLCTVFVSNRDGFYEMTGEKDPQKAVRVMQETYHVREGVICTAGTDGAIWYDGRKEYRAAAYQIEPVDTTGAGDCFLGGLLASYFDAGWDKEASLSFANASASVKCLKAGPRSKADWKTITDFQASHEQKF